MSCYKIDTFPGAVQLYCCDKIFLGFRGDPATFQRTAPCTSTSSSKEASPLLICAPLPSQTPPKAQTQTTVGAKLQGFFHVQNKSHVRPTLLLLLRVLLQRRPHAPPRRELLRRRRVVRHGPGADPPGRRVPRRWRQCWRLLVAAVVLLLLAPVVVLQLQQHPEEHQLALAPDAPPAGRRVPRRRRWHRQRLLLAVFTVHAPAHDDAAAALVLPVLLLRRTLRVHLVVPRPPRLQHRRSPGDEWFVAAAPGAVGRRLRPRGRRAVLSEGRPVQRRGEEGADRALPCQTAPEKLQQEDHLRLPEDAGGQPPAGEGPVREERRDRRGGRRARGVRQQLRVRLQPQRAQQQRQHVQRGQLLRRPVQQQAERCRRRQHQRHLSIQRCRRQWRVVVAGARCRGRRRGAAAAAAGRRLRRRGRALGDPRRHAVGEPGLVGRSRSPAGTRQAGQSPVTSRSIEQPRPARGGWDERDVALVAGGVRCTREHSGSARSGRRCAAQCGVVKRSGRRR